ncbi:proteasome regulatory particle base subunit [Balamuthia mandrillaris]
MTQRTIQSSTLWGVCLSVALLLAAVVLMVAPAAVAGAGTTCLTDFFSAQDAATLKKSVLSLQKKEGLFGSSQDLSDSFYAVSVLAGLGGKVGEVPHKDLLCQQGKNALAAARSSADLKDIFFAAHLVEKLNCGEKVKKEVVSSLESAAVTGTLEDIHAALSTLALLKRNKHAQLDESDLPSVLEKILDLLDVDASFKNMEDDTEGSPLYAGLAYHSLAILFSEFGLSPDQEGSKLSTLVESVSDLFLLAEEEEGILEFIHPQDPLANLRATSLVWTGLNALAAALPDAELAPSAAQVVGMAEYFVQHKHASNLQDAHFVLEAVNLMASNKFKLQPLALTLPTSSLLTTSKGEEGHVKVQITDIQGNFATKARVYIVKAFPVNEGTNIVAMNQELLPVSDKDPKNTAYSFNFLATKPNTGFYAMELSVSPVNASGQTTKNSPYITSNKVVRSLKVITPITISDFVLKVVESKEEEDQSTDPSTEYPNKMDDTLQATVFQSIFFSFRVKNQVSGRNLAAHQVFAIFTNAETQEEAVFIVPRVGNKH